MVCSPYHPPNTKLKLTRSYGLLFLSCAAAAAPALARHFHQRRPYKALLSSAVGNPGCGCQPPPGIFPMPLGEIGHFATSRATLLFPELLPGAAERQKIPVVGIA